MIRAPHRYRQTLVIRINGQGSLDPIIAALNEFTEERLLRIVDARIMAGEPNDSVATVTVEHLWWNRLAQAISDVEGDLLSDLETPKPVEDSWPGPERLRQIELLNQMRRVGTLTEAEFGRAKRELLDIERHRG